MEVCETKYTFDIARALILFNKPAFYLRVYLQMTSAFWFRFLCDVVVEKMQTNVIT